ncbi:hypothetical protein ABBQ32_001991 [Trebouxia sp. C0010 RCD-2024]
MTRYARREIQEVVDFYQPYENEDKRICRCGACAAKADGAPVYQRRYFLKLRTCQLHMAKEGNARPRGRPRAVTLAVASAVQNTPSFYSVQDLVLAKIHDLREERQGFRDGASQAGQDIDFEGFDQQDWEGPAGDVSPPWRHLDKTHGLISDWARRRSTPAAEELASRLPGNDGAMRIKLPMLKLAEAIEDGEDFDEIVSRQENRLTQQENEELCAWGADMIASSLHHSQSHESVTADLRRWLKSSKVFEEFRNAIPDTYSKLLHVLEVMHWVCSSLLGAGCMCLNVYIKYVSTVAHYVGVGSYA